MKNNINVNDILGATSGSKNMGVFEQYHDRK